MSSHNQNEHNAASSNFVSIVLILTFVITLGIMSFGTFPTTLVEAEGEEMVAVAEIATEMPLPTETELPPTVTTLPTLVPTNLPTDVPTIEPTMQPTAVAENTTTSGNSEYAPDVVAHGESLFVACAACHGPDGRGVPNLGKDLVESEFVHSLSDDELVNFIKTGRPLWDPLNTTGIDMPAKGGNPVLTDEDIAAIVAYVRTLGAASNTGEVAEQAKVEQVNNGSDATSASDYDPDVVAYGQTLFLACSACHGADALGLPNLGKNLVENEFVHSLTDDELVEFIKTGRPLWDPLNTTGIDMPAKGGNPVLTDEDILAIVAYIRSLSN